MVFRRHRQLLPYTLTQRPVQHRRSRPPSHVSPPRTILTSRASKAQEPVAAFPSAMSSSSWLTQRPVEQSSPHRSPNHCKIARLHPTSLPEQSLRRQPFRKGSDPPAVKRP